MGKRPFSEKKRITSWRRWSRILRTDEPCLPPLPTALAEVGLALFGMSESSGVRGELGIVSASSGVVAPISMVDEIASVMLKLGPKKVLADVAETGVASGVLAENAGLRLSGGVFIALLLAELILLLLLLLLLVEPGGAFALCIAMASDMR